MIRIIDLLFVLKDGDGASLYMNRTAGETRSPPCWSRSSQPDDESFLQDDAESIGVLLEPNSSAAMLLFENTWASRFVTAMDNANGEVIVNARIPREVIEQSRRRISVRSEQLAISQEIRRTMP